MRQIVLSAERRQHASPGFSLWTCQALIDHHAVTLGQGIVVGLERCSMRLWPDDDCLGGYKGLEAPATLSAAMRLAVRLAVRADLKRWMPAIPPQLG